MITKLDKISDISTEFGTTLASAKQMSWFYNNKNPDSPVQPVMGEGGKITDWIGYDHSAIDPLTQWRYYYNFAKFFDEIPNPPGQYSSFIQVNHSKTGPAASKERCVLYTGPNIADFTKNGYVYITSSDVSTQKSYIMVLCDFANFWASVSESQRRFTIGFKYYFNAVNKNLLLGYNVANTNTNSFGLIMDSGHKLTINSISSAMLDTNGQIMNSVLGKQMVALLHINGRSNCIMSLYDVSADSIVSFMLLAVMPNIVSIASNKIFALLNSNQDVSLALNSGRFYKVAYDDKYIINNESQALECARLFV